MNSASANVSEEVKREADTRLEGKNSSSRKTGNQEPRQRESAAKTKTTDGASKGAAETTSV